MSIKSVYLGRNELLKLKNNLEFIDNELYSALEQYLQNRDTIGEYLINIFYDVELCKLEKLDKEFYLLGDKSILGVVKDDYS